MKTPLVFLVLLSLLVNFSRAADVWGKAPEASDDRFTNPKKMLYAGPDGWWDFGEVRATVANTARTAYGYKGAFRIIMHAFVSVQDKQTLHFDFGTQGIPAAGEYKISAQGSLADKTVKLSFADVSGNEIKEWSSQDGAGVLTVKVVHGFLYFTCRNVALEASGLSNKGESAKAMTLGFEGALSPGSVKDELEADEEN